MQQGAKQGVRGALPVFNAARAGGEDGARELRQAGVSAPIAIVSRAAIIH
jgi:hypothetical protein